MGACVAGWFLCELNAASVLWWVESAAQACAICVWGYSFGGEFEPETVLEAEKLLDR